MDSQEDDELRRLYDEAIQKNGTVYYELFQLKSMSSLIPRVLPPHIKNAVGKLGKNLLGLNVVELVEQIFQIDLSEEEAVYLLLYIGTISMFKESRNSKVLLAESKNTLESTYLDIQNSIDEIAEKLGLPSDVELIKLALDDLGPEDIEFVFMCNQLFAQLQNIELSFIQIGSLENQIRDSLIISVGLAIISQENVQNPLDIERLAEEYFLNQLSTVQVNLN